MPSLRNIEWRRIKTETEKKSSTNIYTNKNISELNELIYAEAKLVCEKVRVPLTSTNKKSIRKFNWGKKEKATQEK